MISSLVELEQTVFQNLLFEVLKKMRWRYCFFVKIVSIKYISLTANDFHKKIQMTYDIEKEPKLTFLIEEIEVT